MSWEVTADFSDLDRLDDLLAAAVQRTPKERATELDKEATAVAAEARATAGSYPNGTGALANTVDVVGSGLVRKIGSPLREGFFLEVGSPHTGGPRPWLSGPARRGAERLLTSLAKVAEPW